MATTKSTKTYRALDKIEVVTAGNGRARTVTVQEVFDGDGLHAGYSVACDGGFRQFLSVQPDEIRGWVDALNTAAERIEELEAERVEAARSELAAKLIKDTPRAVLEELLAQMAAAQQ